MPFCCRVEIWLGVNFNSSSILIVCSPTNGFTKFSIKFLHNPKESMYFCETYPALLESLQVLVLALQSL